MINTETNHRLVRLENPNGLTLKDIKKAPEKLWGEILRSSRETDPYSALRVLDSYMMTMNMELEAANNEKFLRPTVSETLFRNEGDKYRREGNVVVLPKTSEKMIVIGDTQGDFNSLKKVIRESGFIESMLEGKTKTQMVQLGDLIGEGPESVESLLLMANLKLSFPKNVTLLPGKIATHSGKNFSESLEWMLREHFSRGLWERDLKGDPHSYYDLHTATEIEIRLKKLWNKSPRMVVDPNGGILTNGGLFWGAKDLVEFAHLHEIKPNLADDVYDAMDWSEPIDESRSGVAKNKLRSLIEAIDLYLYGRGEDQNKNQVFLSEIEKSSLSARSTARLRSARVEMAILEEKHGIYPNTKRIIGGSMLDAHLNNSYQYTKKTVDAELARLGGAKYIIRTGLNSDDVYDQEPIMFGGKLCCVKSGYRRGAESKSGYLELPLDGNVKLVTKEHIRTVK